MKSSKLETSKQQSHRGFQMQNPYRCTRKQCFKCKRHTYTEFKMQKAHIRSFRFKMYTHTVSDVRDHEGIHPAKHLH